MFIRYIEELPDVEIRADGVAGNTVCGDEQTPWRCSRSLWRMFLETEIRRLNDFEIEERRHARGKVLAFPAKH